MKLVRLTFILVTKLMVVCSYAQVTFDKGYIINNSGTKVDCYIKNVDWLNNPGTITYKIENNSEEQKGTVQNIAEFGIYNASKYVRSAVNIDKSGQSLSELSVKREPEFFNETLFLQVLLEGKVSLYQYTEPDLKRYFVGTKDTGTEQLIYKAYKQSNYEIKYNNRFKQQLWLKLNCSDFSQGTFENVKYSRKDLIKVFIKFHECTNHDYVIFDKPKRKDAFSVSARPGINYTSASIERLISKSYATDFGNKLNFRFGAELEYALPFNKNQWALIFEPTYQYFSSEKGIPAEQISIDYSSIELAIGLRRFIFFNKDSKVFFNASYIIDQAFGSNIELIYPQYNFEVSSSVNIALGAGYCWNEKFTAELRYFSNRHLLNHEAHWISKYKTVSLILGYKLFTK